MNPVLVIDDDPEARETIRDMLDHLGHEVVLAASGEEGLAFLRNGNRPSLVVLDLVLPEMDGWSCLQRVRYMAPRLPVVVITGDAAAPLLRGIGFVGAAAPLPKPFQVDDLEVAMAHAHAAAADQDPGS